MLVVADGAAELFKAIEQCWPASDRQHCCVHQARTLRQAARPRAARALDPGRLCVRRPRKPDQRTRPEAQAAPRRTPCAVILGPTVCPLARADLASQPPSTCGCRELRSAEVTAQRTPSATRPRREVAQTTLGRDPFTTETGSLWPQRRVRGWRWCPHRNHWSGRHPNAAQPGHHATIKRRRCDQPAGPRRTIGFVADRSCAGRGAGDSLVAFAIARRALGLAIPFVEKHSPVRSAHDDCCWAVPEVALAGVGMVDRGAYAHAQVVHRSAAERCSSSSRGAATRAMNSTARLPGLQKSRCLPPSR